MAIIQVGHAQATCSLQFDYCNWFPLSVMQSSIDSPVSPVTAAAPLVFVILVTAVKQGYEDWVRHKADDVVNNRTVHIVKDGELVVSLFQRVLIVVAFKDYISRIIALFCVLQKIKSKEIKVGNILKLEGEEQVPADILVLGSRDRKSVV